MCTTVELLRYEMGPSDNATIQHADNWIIEF